MSALKRLAARAAIAILVVAPLRMGMSREDTKPAPKQVPTQVIIKAVNQDPTYQARRMAVMVRLSQVADLAPAQYAGQVIDAAERYDLDPRLVAAVVKLETGGTWNACLIGSSGDTGLMQIIPETAEWIAQAKGVATYNLCDPATNLDFGTFYLSRLLKANKGDVDEALRRYNAGPAWRDRAPMAARAYSDRVRAHWRK